MNREEKQCLGWMELYEQTQDAGLTCRRCGISRPTLRKWWRRYQDQGVIGVQSESSRPMEYHVKFRPNKPGSPHLNGKVERSEKTDLEEFYPTVNLNSGIVV